MVGKSVDGKNSHFNGVASFAGRLVFAGTASALWWVLMQARFSFLTTVVRVLAMIWRNMAGGVPIDVRGRLERKRLSVPCRDDVGDLCVVLGSHRAASRYPQAARPYRRPGGSGADRRKRLKALKYQLPRVLASCRLWRHRDRLCHRPVDRCPELGKLSGVSWPNILNLWILTIGFSLGTLLFYVLVLHRRKWLPRRQEGSSFFASLFAVDESPVQRYEGFRELPGNAEVLSPDHRHRRLRGFSRSLRGWLILRITRNLWDRHYL